jgi:hypothetical protein
MEKEKKMETTVATLLLITSSVILMCVVVDYAVTTVQQTLNTQNIPQLDRIRGMENNLLNQTDSVFNQTQPDLPTQPSP